MLIQGNEILGFASSFFGDSVQLNFRDLGPLNVCPNARCIQSRRYLFPDLQAVESTIKRKLFNAHPYLHERIALLR